jgi:hypothetical protein
MSLFPLSIVRVPTKQEHKQRVIAGPTLERLRQPESKRAEPTAPLPPAQPRPSRAEAAKMEARAILLSAQKRDGTISRADAKWLENFRAPQRGEESPTRRIEVEKLARAICLVGQKARGELDAAGARRLEDYYAEKEAINELLR